MSEYADIQLALQRARAMCEALERSDECGLRADGDVDERQQALLAVEAMLKSLHGALATANDLMQNRFLREARMGGLRKPH